MKRIYRLCTVAIIMLLAAGTANAQFRFGIKAGLTINKLHIQDVPDNFDSDNRCGFTGGIMGELQIPVIGLCFDASLMYARMNSQLGITDQYGESATATSKDFFEIPLNIKYKISIPVVNKILMPYIYTGPSFAFKLGKDDNVFKTKTFQCAWNVGVGVELLSHLQVGAGYSFGINNIADKVANISTEDNIKVKNNYWTITAAYLF